VVVVMVVVVVVVVVVVARVRTWRVRRAQLAVSRQASRDVVLATHDS
jgi:hypothetical protein